MGARRWTWDVLAVAGLLVVGLLVWAGQQRQPDAYIERVTRSGVLRVGIDPSYPPFAEVRGGSIEGYEPELARAIASDLGVRLEFVPLALDTLYDALEAEGVDLLLSSLPFIFERQAQVRYSRPYYQAGQVLVVPGGSSRIRGVDDLSGRRVGVELGSAADTEARRLARSGVRDLEVVSTFERPEAALDALTAEEVDAAITDVTSAYAYLRAHPRSVRILSPTLTDEPYVIAVPVRAGRLAASVDATLERLRASSELARIMGLSD